MHFKKKFIYFILLFLISHFILPIHFSFASNLDSVYVWSNFEETQSATEIQEENFRKFFEYYFWKWCSNGSKDWASSV